MKKIGLTGSIGAGKTYVAEIFRRLEVPVFNADIQGKECLENDKNLIRDIKQQFGSEMYDENILRKELLADIVFNNDHSLEKLNALVHPIVKEKFRLWCQQQDAKLVIKEAAILFESKSHLDMDAVICVSAPKKMRIQRVQLRDSSSIDDIQKRINKQMKQIEKEKLSDYIIYNDEIQLLLPQIIHIIKQEE